MVYASDYTKKRMLQCRILKKKTQNKQKVTLSRTNHKYYSFSFLSKNFTVKSPILVMLLTSQNVMMKKLNFVSSSSMGRTANAKMTT